MCPQVREPGGESGEELTMSQSNVMQLLGLVPPLPGASSPTHPSIPPPPSGMYVINESSPFPRVSVQH